MTRTCSQLHVGLLAAFVAAWLSAISFVNIGTTFAQQAPAVTATGAPAADALSEDAIKARQAELQSELSRLREERQAVEHGSREDSQREELLEHLGRIESILDAELQVYRRLKPVKETTPSTKEASTPSILTLNVVHQNLEAAESEREKLENAVEASRDTLAAAKEEYEEAERRRREARDATEDTTSAIATVDAQHSLQLRRLESRAAQETMRLRELELEAARTALDAHRSRTEDLRLQLARIEAAIREGTDEPPSDTSRLQEATKLTRSREALERDLSAAEARLSTAKDRYARSREPSPRMLEEIDTLTARRDALQQDISSTAARIERLKSQATVLNRWRRVLRDEAQRNDLNEWKASAEQEIHDLELAEPQKEGRLAELRERLRSGRERLTNLSADDPVRAILDARLTVLGDLASLYQDDLAEMAAQRHLMERFVDAIDQATGHVSVRERLMSVAGFLHSIWNYELAVVDDEGITTGEVVIALALIVLGFILSRRVSRAFATSLHRRFRLDTGAAAAIETLTFYLLLAAFVLLSLRTVNFPLTAFTILGGALAIGIGFGSQNIMNNFISGLILLLERPIRSGDLVSIEGSFGTVEKIGARSTQIRATDNTHLIVPNSFFLENKVVNWTLSDDVIRTQVNVGVTYGSPTRTVEELLRRVLDENEKILRTPTPVIVFAEFGDNSLNFEVYFFVRARTPMAIRRIGSEVRFRIDDLFREAGVVIAFPQRDVHFDATGPIDVRVLGEPPADPGAKRS